MTTTDNKKKKKKIYIFIFAEDKGLVFIPLNHNVCCAKYVLNLVLMLS